MLDRPRRARTLALLVCLTWPAVLFAAEGQAPANAPATVPVRMKGTQKGCRELRLQQVTTTRFAGVPSAGVTYVTGLEGELQLGGVVGIGFCLTDHVELGGQLGVSLIRVGDDIAIGLPFNAFLKLNVLAPSTRWNPFVEVSLGGFAAPGAVGGTAGIRAGLEVFIRPSWAVFVAPGFEALFGAGFLGFARFGWGISAYF